MEKVIDTRDTSDVKQSTTTDSMWDIASKRFRKRNSFEENDNEFGFSYIAFEGVVLV